MKGQVFGGLIGTICAIIAAYQLPHDEVFIGFALGVLLVLWGAIAGEWIYSRKKQQ